MSIRKIPLTSAVFSPIALCVPKKQLSLLVQSGKPRLKMLGQSVKCFKNATPFHSVLVEDEYQARHILFYWNNTFLELMLFFRGGGWVHEADAKSTPSYFLGPTSIGIIMPMSGLWWQYRSKTFFGSMLKLIQILKHYIYGAYSNVPQRSGIGH